MMTPHTTGGSIEEHSNRPSSQPSSFSSSTPVGKTGLATENLDSFSSTLFPTRKTHHGPEERSASSLRLPSAAKYSTVEQKKICKIAHCLGCRRYGEYRQSEIHCQYQGCSETCSNYVSYLVHLKAAHTDLCAHCLESKCKFSTKRVSDLGRHYAAKHCQAPRRFACPSSDCKYSGDNGFTRKDKLISHQRKMHKGEFCAPPRRGPRAIQPAAPRSSTNAASHTLNANERME